MLCANKIIHEIAIGFESKLPWGEKYIFTFLLSICFFYFFPNLCIRIEEIGLPNFCVGQLFLFVPFELTLGIGA